MPSASGPEPRPERRQHHRVLTRLHLRVKPLPPGEGTEDPAPPLSEVTSACYGVLDALRDLRLDLDLRDRIVADRIQGFCLAVATAIERIESRLAGEEPGEPVAAELSGGGLTFPSREPLTPGSPLAVSFRILDVPAPGMFHLRAEVVTCRPAEVGGLHRIGARFLDVDERVQDRLISLLFAVQRAQMRRER